MSKRRMRTGMDPEASVNVINVYICNIDTCIHSRLSEDAWIRRHDCSQTRILRVGKLDLNLESRWASWFDPAFPSFRFIGLGRRHFQSQHLTLTRGNLQPDASLTSKLLVCGGIVDGRGPSQGNMHQGSRLSPPDPSAVSALCSWHLSTCW
jgi:hypothetical protein